MIDIELKKQLEEINKNIVVVGQRNVWWRSLLHGTMSGFGSVLGVVIALAVIGWLLNIAGIIPAFRKEADKWRQVIDQAQQQRLPSKIQNGQ